jgi:hypothetical protein
VTAGAARIAQGTSRTQIALDLTATAEYHRLIAEDMHAAFLGRTMTSTDYAVLSALSTYVNPSTPFPGLITREEVAAYLVGGGEYYQGKGGGTDDGWLDALYQDALARAPTQAERDAFAQSGTGQGARQTFALDLFRTDEYRVLQIEGFYQTFLRRGLDAAGQTYWLGQYQMGLTTEAVLARILESQEYYDYCNR